MSPTARAVAYHNVAKNANGLCLLLTSLLVKGFEVHGFWAAIFGALIVSVVSWLLTAFVSDRGRIVVITRR
jgi:putative membrane protein